MGLLSTEVEVNVSGKQKERYTDLGYNIPKYINRDGHEVVKIGTYIKVNTFDLPLKSNVSVLIRCDNCGKEYKLPYYSFLKQNHGGKTYCKKCAITVLRSGENAYQWNFNKTNEERINNRKTPENKELIKNVLARDNYTCQVCETSIKGNGIVHHLNGYNWYIEGRIDQTNCISLCENCHNNFHNIYGRGNNTKEQFEEWIGQTLPKLEKYNYILPSARKAYCLEDDLIIDSLTKFANINKYSEIHLNRCCNLKEKSYRKKHYLWLDEYEKMTKEDIDNYLKWCQINKGKYIKGNNYHLQPRCVICLTTKEIFESILKASKYYNSNNISSCCRGKTKYSGCLDDGTRLEWMYYEDYLIKYNKKD